MCFRQKGEGEGGPRWETRIAGNRPLSLHVNRFSTRYMGFLVALWRGWGTRMHGGWVVVCRDHHNRFTVLVKAPNSAEVYCLGIWRLWAGVNCLLWGQG